VIERDKREREIIEERETKTRDKKIQGGIKFCFMKENV
jgi:hypothetical protein